jgi:hypothetical protein
MVDASGLDKEDVIMDARRFDTVTKAMAHDTTRRRVLRGLVAGICGGALIGLTGRQASAGKCCAEASGRQGGMPKLRQGVHSQQLRMHRKREWHV